MFPPSASSQRNATHPPNTLISQHPLVAHKLTKLRDQATSPKMFRELVRELTSLLIYEATYDLELEPVEVQTPLTTCAGASLKRQVGLVPILRAGLGMVEGAWELIPGAEVWHIGLKRDETTLEPEHYYANKPVEPKVQLCLVLDPMLATGGSAIAACDLLKSWGVKHIKFIGLLGTPQGAHALHKAHPDVQVHLAELDEVLNEQGFIVPGLGDAGDRQFGT